MAQASNSGNKTAVRSTDDHDGDGDGRADGVVVVGVSGSALIDEDKLVLTDDNDTTTSRERRIQRLSGRWLLGRRRKQKQSLRMTGWGICVTYFSQRM